VDVHAKGCTYCTRCIGRCSRTHLYPETSVGGGGGGADASPLVDFSEIVLQLPQRLLRFENTQQYSKLGDSDGMTDGAA